MNRKPRSWSDRLDGATVTLHRFDERGGGEGVNFLELRLREEAELLHVKQKGER